MVPGGTGAEAPPLATRPVAGSIPSKTENSNSHGFKLHGPSMKGTKTPFQVINAIIIIYVLMHRHSRSCTGSRREIKLLAAKIPNEKICDSGMVRDSRTGATCLALEGLDDDVSACTEQRTRAPPPTSASRFDLSLPSR